MPQTPHLALVGGNEFRRDCDPMDLALLEAVGGRAAASIVILPTAATNENPYVAGENGIGKRTSFEEYRVQSRGGKGIITMKTTEKTGAVVGALTVQDRDEIMLITVGGQMVRTFVKDIREAGRNTMGVKLVNLDEGDKLQAIAPVIGESAEDAAGVEPAPTPAN